MKIGEKIKILRKIHNMSQEELSEKLNLTKSSLSKYENGTITPSIRKIKKLSEIFDISIDNLTSDDNLPRLENYQDNNSNKIISKKVINFSIILDLSDKNINYHYSNIEEYGFCTDNSLLPKRLKSLRKEYGLTQEEISNSIGITKSGYGYYEQGKTLPDVNTLCKLADIFCVTMDYLVGRTEIKINNNNTDTDYDMSDEAKAELENFKQYLKSKYK